jgi:hypothetical protein
MLLKIIFAQNSGHDTYLQLGVDAVSVDQWQLVIAIHVKVMV